MAQTDRGQPLAAVTGLDLRAIIRRWVSGFHAALYREALPVSTKFMTNTPLQEARVQGNLAESLPVAEAIPKFVQEIDRNRATHTVDVVECRNRKCRYECVWATADNGRWMCIYTLDVYGWSKLGDATRFDGRACMGCYVPVSELPPTGAAVSTKLDFDLCGGPALELFTA